MITIPANDTIAGAAPSGASEVTCTLFLMELNTGTGAETYTKDQQQLASSVATIYTATANGPTLVRSIHVVNTDTSAPSTFQLFVGGTAAANAITPVFTIPAGGAAIYEDGLGWQFFDSAGKLQEKSGISRIGIQRFINTGSETYYPADGLLAALVICTGGGGGGGGADTSGGASGDVGVAAGGGAGGTAIGFFTAAQIGASKALSVGTGGTAGSNTGTDGTAGGNSTWDTTTLVGTGGALGLGSGSSTSDSMTRNGGLGGVPTGGTINITGGPGDPGIASSFDGTIDFTFGMAGKGGASFWGGGGRAGSAAVPSLVTDQTQAGTAGTAYGAGGGGGVDLTATSGVAGGAGMPGIVMVIEFIGQHG